MNAIGIPLSEIARQKLSDYIEQELGIRMPPVKHDFLRARLAKRLHINNLNSFSDYYDFLLTAEGQTKELPLFVDTITTNKTDFFREQEHYNFLVEKLLPSMSHYSEIKIWSSACSTGEEAYTLSMLLDYFKIKHGLDYDYTIFASDISTQALKTAFQAVYTEERIQPIPMEFRKKYLLKNHNNSKLYRIAPYIRSKVVFRQVNLLRPVQLSYRFDIIFCRNVLIYFDRERQKRAIFNQYPLLKENGILFISHVESLINYQDHFINIAPSVYRRS